MSGSRCAGPRAGQFATRTHFAANFTSDAVVATVGERALTVEEFGQ